MRLLFLSIALVMISGVLLINSTVQNETEVQDQPQVLAASTTSEARDEMLEAVNDYRRLNGLGSLQASSELKQLTAYRANDMVANQYYSHRSPNGTSYADEIKDYLPDSVSSCENLQMQNSDDVSQAVQAWIKSSSHRECLLNPKLQQGAVSAAYFDDISNLADDSVASYVFVFIGSN